MQGPQGPGDQSWSTPPGRRLASLNGTGKHPPVPQRPPSMTRVERPPQMPRVERPSTVRVERPQRQAPSPGPWQRRLFILLGVFVVCGLLACGAGYALVNYVNGLNASGSPAVVINDFYHALSQEDYQQAYKDLDVNITLQLSPEEFEQQGKDADRCYGPIVSYTEVGGSAISQGSTQSYSYNVTRSKLSKQYQMRVTLQQEQDAGNSWKIDSYGSNLGPDQASCK